MQATREYNILSVRLHDANAGRNFPHGLRRLELVEFWVATVRKMREDWEARERLEVEQAGEAHMAELRPRYPERIEAERKLYEQ